jgi:hypothetical protein
VRGSAEAVEHRPPAARPVVPQIGRFYTGCRSGKLMHHDPVALDFVQIKLDGRGDFRCFPVTAPGFHLYCAAGRRATDASSGRLASRGCLSCWTGGTASGNPYDNWLGEGRRGPMKLARSAAKRLRIRSINMQRV